MTAAGQVEHYGVYCRVAALARLRRDFGGSLLLAAHQFIDNARLANTRLACDDRNTVADRGADGRDPVAGLGTATQHRVTCRLQFGQMGRRIRQFIGEVSLVKHDGSRHIHDSGGSEVTVDYEPVRFRPWRGNDQQQINVGCQNSGLPACVRACQGIAALVNVRNQPLFLVGDRFCIDEVAAHWPQPFAFYASIGLGVVRHAQAHAAAEGCDDLCALWRHRGSMPGCREPCTPRTGKLAAMESEKGRE